jgi:protein-S-isoprenylcysteine O-methyltransferase Ste14
MSTDDNPGVIAPPPLIALATLASAAALEHFAPIGWLAGASPALRWIGGAMIVLALGVAVTAITSFNRAGTNVRTHRTTTALVTTGVYGLARNPIYIGFFLLLMGIALAAAWDWLVLLTFAFMAVIHWGVVRREERYLTSKFGDAYTAYLARVRRYGLF